MAVSTAGPGPEVSVCLYLCLQKVTQRDTVKVSVRKQGLCSSKKGACFLGDMLCGGAAVQWMTSEEEAV